MQSVALVPSTSKKGLSFLLYMFRRHGVPRDIEAGRNLGNWVLRWLDHIKPSAEIRSHSTDRRSSSSNNLIPEQPRIYRRPMASHKHYAKIADTVSRGRLLFARWNSMAKYSPAVAMLMMRPTLGMNGQLRQICDRSSRGPVAYRGYGGVLREDIALLLEGN
ncbi:hypothetical protein KSP40_PGU022533 [Platanthera guangdongensis]|uniref:Uncharacterized protein n=1 Tax=Platanthera guangdongensis TaxID=2320717 RepID=A0ABR2MKM8_9ASPA